MEVHYRTGRRRRHGLATSVFRWLGHSHRKLSVGTGDPTDPPR